MASASATWTPNSLQLRLALNCGNSRKFNAVLARARVRKLNREVRALCLAQNEEPPRNGDSWNGSDLAANALSGWSGPDDSEQPIESQRKNWIGGAVGAGVAGVVLVAGLTFAALAISKRNTSKPVQQMEPLTADQEVSLAYVDDNEDKVEGGNESNHVKNEDGIVESQTGKDQDYLSSSEYNEDPNENKIDNDNKNSSLDYVKDASNGSHAMDSVSIQEEHNPEIDYKSIAPETTPSSTQLAETEIPVGSSVAPSHKDEDGSISASLPEPTSEVEVGLVSVGPSDLSISETLQISYQEQLPNLNVKEYSEPLSHPSLDAEAYAPSEPMPTSISIGSQLNTTSDSHLETTHNLETIDSAPTEENPDINRTSQVSDGRIISSLEIHRLDESGASKTSVSTSAYPSGDQQDIDDRNAINGSKSFLESLTHGSSFLPAGIPAPSTVSAALQVLPGKVLVPAIVDQVQSQALAALQALKVIEADAQPIDLCTRREYARWLVSASSALSRNTVSKVYPAMYIENVTELAFDDITPEDPDFSSIQGLAEAGLISSKLSNHDLLNDQQGPLCFSPESPLSRQDLVSWKMALEKRQLPEANRKILYQLSGFIDIDKINPDAWPALVADISAGEQGIIALAFGCTRLFQPAKPVTKAQAAVALATGEAFDIVSEELTRIEAESMAENAVSAHNALVAQVEKDINATFEKELSMEREKIDAVEKMAEQARLELERLRTQREEENIALLKERAAIESEMEVLSRLRREVEDQLESLLNNKVEISYAKERINKLRKEAEDENQEIARLQHELEIERKALSMARAWAEDEAKRAREQAKALEEARDRWERHGIKVVVDSDLREESTAGVTWLKAGEQYSVEGTAHRAESLVDKLKILADGIIGRSRTIINKIIQYILHLVGILKDWASVAGKKAEELKENTSTKTKELKEAAVLKARGSIQELQQSTAQISFAVKEGAKRVAGDCREGVEKLTQKFKT